ncbi:hypothetical protein H696_06276 [Fonticula alba]|uniref:Uncharacterized protein n=1 Tax=Fonticula alba TaxID=691883 RepID=A0A058YZ87_FONAL|nr:hypothetical protein H696_06276 [Fonticula alba]KCV67304.1 hypothetical protein H696_06276 [Fonticula alba]|eukprot:XP_009498291.1 hypothetical protein H696_06276 [Fonticula alba]
MTSKDVATSRTPVRQRQRPRADVANPMQPQASATSSMPPVKAPNEGLQSECPSPATRVLGRGVPVAVPAGPKNPVRDRRIWVDWVLELALVLFALPFRTRGFAFPGSVVFDELHFTRMARDYLTGWFHLDVHPPFGKMFLAYAGHCQARIVHFLSQIGLTGFVDACARWAGFPRFSAAAAALEPLGDVTRHLGSLEQIGSHFSPEPTYYVGMRLLSVIVGVGLLPLLFKSLRIQGVGRPLAVFMALLLMFESSFEVQSRFAFLDSQLIFWCGFAWYYWIRYETRCDGFLQSMAAELRNSDTEARCEPGPRVHASLLGWQGRLPEMDIIYCGILLGLACSVKTVGLFTVAAVVLRLVVLTWRLAQDPRLPLATTLARGVRHLVTILLCVAGILGGFYAWHLSLLSGHAPAHVNSIGGIRHLGPHWSQMLTAAADHPGDEVPMSKVDVVAFGSQVTLGLSSNALDGDHRGSFLCTPELPAAASDAPAAAPGHRLVAVDRGPLCRQAHWTVELADRDIASAEASVTTSPQLRPNSFLRLRDAASGSLLTVARGTDHRPDAPDLVVIATNSTKALARDVWRLEPVASAWPGPLSLSQPHLGTYLQSEPDGGAVGEMVSQWTSAAAADAAGPTGEAVLLSFLTQFHLFHVKAGCYLAASELRPAGVAGLTASGRLLTCVKRPTKQPNPIPEGGLLRRGTLGLWGPGAPGPGVPATWTVTDVLAGASSAATVSLPCRTTLPLGQRLVELAAATLRLHRGLTEQHSAASSPWAWLVGRVPAALYWTAHQHRMAGRTGDRPDLEAVPASASGSSEIRFVANRPAWLLVLLVVALVYPGWRFVDAVLHARGCGPDCTVHGRSWLILYGSEDWVADDVRQQDKLYPAGSGADLRLEVTRRAGCRYQTSEWLRRMDASWLGWLCHFVPFCLMGRTLFAHHYLVALFFGYLLMGLALQMGWELARRRWVESAATSSTNAPRWMGMVIFGCATALVAGLLCHGYLAANSLTN